MCNATPAEGALSRVLTVCRSLCFTGYFLFGGHLSMALLLVLREVLPACLPYRAFSHCYYFALLCMIIACFPCFLPFGLPTVLLPGLDCLIVFVPLPASRLRLFACCFGFVCCGYIKHCTWILMPPQRPYTDITSVNFCHNLLLQQRHL